MNGTEFARISGSYSTAFVGTYERTGQSTSGNYTTFKLRGYFYYGGSSSNGVGSSGSTYTGFYLDDTHIASGSYRYYSGYTLLGEKDITVYHSNDGSFPGKTVSISANSYHMSGNASGNLSAPNITRKAELTNTYDFNDDENPIFYFSNPGNFYLRFALEWNNQTENIVRDIYSAPSSPYTLVLTDEERDRLRKACTGDSMPIRMTIATSISGTYSQWSWLDKTFTRKRRISVFPQENVRKLGDPYVYAENTYKRGIPYIYKDGSWKIGTS